MLEHHLSADSRPERVVVLGASGFVGRAILRRATEGGSEAVGLSSADLSLLAPDAADRLAALLRPQDSVVFVSALTPDRGRDAGTMLANLRMAEAVGAAVGKVVPAHLVYISSDAVYRDDANPVTERSCCEPSSFHGMMHLARELILRTGVKAPLALLRPSLLYGIDDTHNGYGPNRFRRQAAKGEPITLFGGGEERRDHVHVDDVAELTWRVLARRSSGLLNIATGRSVSFREVAELVVSGFERPVDIVPTPRANPITHRHFDVTDAIKAFPDFHCMDIASGIARVHGEMVGRGHG
ncbi:NAD-dependent epimerase/dehydratase family protein [Azospirillum rugosum]|uniref:Nucleoside-diphosphate-sugar epimerase n=1 Tax=Azospirillum rugosum TaxID=416170 RepID=A0ABS4SP01_9PROT|nr:SDR family oxidoreductase [Azospirillum rugosum]MBP2294287.1 nucleoside-diphosphate-sugar epimerase [Azospirillum rugosum]MDQ0527622.1 nucleoside-diphosphate-sugar epimerase [Azospirillum rugosum]